MVAHAPRKCSLVNSQLGEGWQLIDKQLFLPGPFAFTGGQLRRGRWRAEQLPRITEYWEHADT